MDLKASTNELISHYRDYNSMTCPNRTAVWYLLYSRHIVSEKHLKAIMQLDTIKKQILEELSCQVKNGDNPYHVHISLRLVKEASIIKKLPMVTDGSNNHKTLFTSNVLHHVL